MKKKLIICADDFGLTQGINRAIVRCYIAGRISLTTIIPNSMFFDEAINLAKTHEIPCGVHLTLATEFDLSPLCSLLKDTPKNNDGTLFSNIFPYLNGADEELVYNEFRAQILKVINAGLNPTHIDSHMHVFSIPLLKRLSEEFHIPCRDFIEHQPKPDEIHFHLTTCGDTEEKKIHALIKFISEINKRVNIVICHPTDDSDEMCGYISNHYPGRYYWLTVLRFQDINCLMSDIIGMALENTDAILTDSFT